MKNLRSFFALVVFPFLTFGSLHAEEASDTDAKVERLIADLKSTDWRVQYRACIEIEKLGPAAEKAVPALLDIVYSQSKVREISTYAIASIGKAALPVLFDSFQSSSTQNESALCLALSLVRPVEQKSVLKISEILQRTSSDDSRSSLAWALARMAPESIDAVPGLMTLIESRNNDLRGRALDALGVYGKDLIKYKNQLTELLKPHVRTDDRAAQITLWLERPELAPDLNLSEPEEIFRAFFSDEIVRCEAAAIRLYSRRRDMVLFLDRAIECLGEKNDTRAYRGGLLFLKCMGPFAVDAAPVLIKKLSTESWSAHKDIFYTLIRVLPATEIHNRDLHSYWDLTFSQYEKLHGELKKGGRNPDTSLYFRGLRLNLLLATRLLIATGESPMELFPSIEKLLSVEDSYFFYHCLRLDLPHMFGSDLISDCSSVRGSEMKILDYARVRSADPDRKMRLMAIRVLSGLVERGGEFDAPAREIFLRLLDDDDAEVRLMAARFMVHGTRSDQLNLVEIALNGNLTDLWRSINLGSLIIDKYGADKARRMLPSFVYAATLTGENKARIFGATQLSRMTDDPLGDLAKLLRNDPSKHIRRYAACALIMLGKEGVAKLDEIENDADDETKNAIAEAWAIGEVK